MTAQQKKNCINARTALEDIYSNGNLKRYKVTPYEANQIAELYNSLVTTGKVVTTIAEGVMNFFKSYGFNTKVNGIGWEISL